MTAFMVEVAADLNRTDMERQAQRKPGLSMSALGLCRRRAGYLLAETEPGEDGDKWNAMRGTYLHIGILTARKAQRPDLIVPEVDGTPCPPLILAGLEVPGTPDEVDDGAVTDYKTVSPEMARWHASNGPDLNHTMQAVGYALAWGRTIARVVYVPVVGTFDDWVVCEVVASDWTVRLSDWLIEVSTTDLDLLPQDKWYDWCQDYCPFFTACRGDWDPAELEDITDPTFIAAAAQYVAAREAAKDKDAAASVIRGAVGRAGGITVRTRTQAGKRSADLKQIAADYAAAGVEVPQRQGAPSDVLDVKVAKAGTTSAGAAERLGEVPAAAPAEGAS